MKKFLFLICLAVTIVSCENLQTEYSVNGLTKIVKKETKHGTRYAVGCNIPKKNAVKALTPVVFTSYKKVTDSFAAYFFYTENSKTYYMFDGYGADVLSGTINTSSLESFIPILNDGKDHRLTGNTADTYYRHMVKYDIDVGGDYFILPTLDGSLYGVIRAYGFLSVGPYKQMRFGLTGYMYQDLKTGKYGAKTVADLESSPGCTKRNVVESEIQRRLDLLTPTIFSPEYDEIIEVEINAKWVGGVMTARKVRDKRNIWFARKGDIWIAKEAVGARNIKDIPVDQKLLNRVLKMQILSEPRSQKSNDVPAAAIDILAIGQRFGSAEMSIAHL